jgi:hypothetical protein
MKLTMIVLAGALAFAQQPQIQNAKVETRRVTGSLDREIATIAATSTEPLWVGWREPAISGMGGSCCYYQWDNEPGIRGCVVEPSVPNTLGFGGSNQPAPRPQFAPPSGPARLEAGTEVLIMARIVDKQVERIRTYSDDCPLDASNRAVYWLDGVTPAESLRYLNSLILLTDKPGTPTDMRKRINSAALSAIGLHRDGTADLLIALAKQTADASVRSSAFSWLGKSRDPKAVAFIDGILKK